MEHMEALSQKSLPSKVYFKWAQQIKSLQTRETNTQQVINLLIQCFMVDDQYLTLSCQDMMTLWTVSAGREVEQAFRSFVDNAPPYKLAQVVDVLVESGIKHNSYPG